MNEDPLEINFAGQNIIDNGTVKLGRLIANSNESEDWHKFNLDIMNNSRNELVNISIDTNLGEDLFRFELPSQLGAKETVYTTLQLRASKLLVANLKGKPYIFIKYKEVKHY